MMLCIYCLLYSRPTFIKAFAVGEQVICKFKEKDEAANTIQIFMAILRFKHVIHKHTYTPITDAITCLLTFLY